MKKDPIPRFLLRDGLGATVVADNLPVVVVAAAVHIPGTVAAGCRRHFAAVVVVHRQTAEAVRNHWLEVDRSNCWNPQEADCCRPPGEAVDWPAEEEANDFQAAAEVAVDWRAEEEANCWMAGEDHHGCCHRCLSGSALALRRAFYHRVRP